MNQTVDLLEKIRRAIIEGKLSADQVPVSTIKHSIMSEIRINRNTFLEEQYIDILQKLQRLCNDMPDKERDIEKILFFIDAVVLCISMISQAIKTLANGEYWSLLHQQELDNPEVLEIINYVDRERKVQMLNYDFVGKYVNMPCTVNTDKKSGMKYLFYKGRKMFFPRGWEEDRISDYFRSVIAEQDEISPHCYKKEGFYVEQGDVVVDAGAAEGIFSLDVIDIAKKIYLIEADEQWVEALRQTFRDDADKVTIIYGFLDNDMEKNRVSIDGLFTTEEINYIKMDIEGYEKPSLLGAVKTLNKCSNIRCAICAYHCKEDAEWIMKRLKACNMIVDTSRGYICPDWSIDAYLKAELRRGIVFGKKV